MKKKSICVVTWYSSINCGTCLQAKALYEVLGRKSIVKMLAYKQKYNIFSIQDLKIILRKIYIKCNNIFVRPQTDFVVKDIRRQRITVFEHSAFEYLYLGQGKARKGIIDEMDYFIVGSDQLWNPAFFQERYYLDFVPETKKKKAYGTSIGVDFLPEKLKKRLALYWNDFDTITVRENKAKQLIEDVTGREDIQIVVDPTMLLTEKEWRDIYINKSELNIEQINYVLCYFVGDMASYREEIIAIANKLNLKIIVIPMKETDYSVFGCEVVEAGPYEFLDLIDNATFVCTDSFHATTISITFHKMFTVFERIKKQGELEQGSRLQELLARYNIENCKFDSVDNIILQMDYDNIDKDIQTNREKSLKVLYEMLGYTYGEIS